ncbi:hypothetical protein F5Y12DRAFT_781540 [Xylaria sp. FL1777]|nr:hypothetical protein F5Y12DRAFT_781540 [Xylaria sp. FL1777]
MPNLGFASLPPATQQQILNGPSLAPPPGVKPKFKHPADMDTLVVPVVVMSLILSSLFFLLYAYGKWHIRSIINMSDSYLTIWVLALTRAIFHGIFVHQWDIQYKNLDPFLFYTFIGTNLYIVTACLLKTAILLEWFRIFPWSVHRTPAWICYATIAFNLMWWMQSLIIMNVQCKPQRHIWDKTIPGVCIQEKVYNVITSVKRLGISSIVIIGVMACASAAGRLAYTIQYLKSQDDSYEYSAMGLWAIAEITCEIMVFTIAGEPRVLLPVVKLFELIYIKASSYYTGQKCSARSPYMDSDTQNLRLVGTLGSAYTGIDLQRVTEPGDAAIRTTRFEMTFENACRLHTWLKYC